MVSTDTPASAATAAMVVAAYPPSRNCRWAASRMASRSGLPSARARRSVSSSIPSWACVVLAVSLRGGVGSEQLGAGGVAEPLLVLLRGPAAHADQQLPHVWVVERPQDVGC